MKDKKSTNTGDTKISKNKCDSSLQSTSNPYTKNMNNTNTLNDTFTPSFTPNIGLALCIDWGAAGVYELISDTRTNDSGEYELKIHTWLGGEVDFFGDKQRYDWFIAGRWFTLREISERFAETRSAFRNQYNDQNWSGTKVFNMAKVRFRKPL
jgi:hypothetical protein